MKHAFVPEDRFDLPAHGERADTLLREMIDEHVAVQYDPLKPSRSFVPEETIEGCDVKQRLI